MLSGPLGMLVLRPLGRDSAADQRQTLPVTGPGQPVWIYKAIPSFWLPLWGLGVCRRMKLCSKASFYQHQAQGPVSRIPKHPESHLYLLAG